MKVPPTPRQLDALHFIRDFIETHEFGPTFQEIMDSINMSSKSEVSRVVNGLIERGHIGKIPFRRRAIYLL